MKSTETDSDPSSKLRDSHLQGGETIDLVQYAETESVTVSHSFVGFPSAKPIRHISTPKPEAVSTRVPQSSSRVSKRKRRNNPCQTKARMKMC